MAAIIDINAWTGAWSSFPLRGEVGQVRSDLVRIGVERICMAPLGAAWCHNPHVYNQEVYQAAEDHADIDPVPVLDPTIPTWPQELERAVDHPRVAMVKLLPAYGQYELEGHSHFCAALAEAGLVAMVQTRLEDPRRQHPLAQVPDVEVAPVVALALNNPPLKLVIGGLTWSAILGLRAQLLDCPNLYVDTSQADGMDSLKVMVDKGLGAKLLFGTHAPLFVPLAGVARVVADLDDETASAILGGNALKVLGP